MGVWLLNLLVKNGLISQNEQPLEQISKIRISCVIKRFDRLYGAVQCDKLQSQNDLDLQNTFVNVPVNYMA